MCSRQSGISIWRDLNGASLVEFTVVMPVLFVLTLGTVDLGYLLYDYGLANKAAYVGAHRAILSNPAAIDVRAVSWDTTKTGNNCSSASGTTGDCSTYAASTMCTATSNSAGTCTGTTYTFSSANFNAIVGAMQKLYGCTAGSSTCQLQPTNVSITYAISGTLGFVGQPNGLPMNVTVAVRCMYHPFYFIGALLSFVYTAQSGCNGPATGWAIPAYSTTLTSEDLATN
jgi:Flp pilus assembly protein TadG